MSDDEPHAELTDADFAALLLPMAERFKADARRMPAFADLARTDTAAELLRAACRQMEPQIDALERTLRVELHEPVGPEQRQGLLGVAYLMHALTAHYRQETHVGCVDRAVREVVRLVTLGASLTTEQWRAVSGAVRLAQHRVELIALNVMDLLDIRSGLPQGAPAPTGGSSHDDRYGLLLGLPLVARRALPAGDDLHSDSSLAVFERIAERL